MCLSLSVIFLQHLQFHVIAGVHLPEALAAASGVLLNTKNPPHHGMTALLRTMKTP